MYVLDNVGREVQEADRLCWAAVSTMAVRAFPEQGEFRHPTQRQTVIFREARINTVADYLAARDATDPHSGLRQRFLAASQDCRKTGSCNLPSNDLHLFDVKSTKVASGFALSPQHFEIEIGARRRPVPIRWSYLGNVVTNGQTRKGDHALIVTGFNPATYELRVFDPWPADAGRGSLAAHEKWIPFNVYLDPQNDHGLDAVARHEFDEYRLLRVNEDDAQLDQKYHYPALLPLENPMPARPARQATLVDFEQPEITSLHDAIARHMRSHVVRNSSGDIIHGPYDVGQPIPVVPVEAQKILDEGNDTDSLFTSTTSAFAVPVSRNGQVIDSVLMLSDRDTWRASGYCNNKITSLLLQGRDMNRCKERPDRGFYLLSIPELSTFFLAHGFRDKANIAALNRGGMARLTGCRQSIAELRKRVQSEVAGPVQPYPAPVAA